MNLKNKTILVVEDEDFSYLFIQGTLEEEKMRIIRARTGNEAVELIKESEKNIDLILMDIQLPGMNGWDATREILKINRSMPVIAQTAYAMQKQMDKCYDAGCIDYIAKPYDSEQLLDLIRKHI